MEVQFSDGDDQLEMRRQASKAQVMSQAWDRPVASVSATDRSRSVTVALDGNSQLNQIRIGDNWSQTYSPETLEAAVMTTYADALTKQMQLRQKNFELAQRTEDQNDACSYLLPGDDEDRIPSIKDVYSRLHALDSLLDDLLGVIDAASDQADAQTSARYTGKCSGDVVQIDLDMSGGLCAVRFRDRWLDRATGFAINLALNDALKNAKQSLVDGLQVNPLSPLGKLHAFSEELKEY